MNQRMKLVIAYDGSEGADAVFFDLPRAGLPRAAEAVVISVAERWLPPIPAYAAMEVPPTEQSRYWEEQALAQAEQAAERLGSAFPEWEVSAEAASGSPEREIVRKADQWQADLIVVGSHGRTALGRFFLGSVSQKVAADAHCSVRIARGQAQEGVRPVRIAIGLDGLPGADAAVRTVASRFWPPQTEARLITTVGPYTHAADQGMKEEIERAEAMQAQAAALLREAGIEVSSIVTTEDPKQSILQEAERMGADCIFVGNNRHSGLERFVLGSVSTAIATRAHCSVEVVRAEKTEAEQ